MKNKELFDRANRDDDKELKTKLREDFLEWCRKNGRTPLNPDSTIDWWGEDVVWKEGRK